MAAKTGISPLAILVSALFWAWVWGPAGLLLSTPLTVCLAVLGRHVERLRFLSTMLGDEPALATPGALLSAAFGGRSRSGRKNRPENGRANAPGPRV